MIEIQSTMDSAVSEIENELRKGLTQEQIIPLIDERIPFAIRKAIVKRVTRNWEHYQEELREANFNASPE